MFMLKKCRPNEVTLFIFTVELLGLLNWSCNPAALKHSLTAFRNVSGGEVMKYLQDVLDALFNILMQNSDSDLYDDLVFKCIVSSNFIEHLGVCLWLKFTIEFSSFVKCFSGTHLCA